MTARPPRRVRAALAAAALATALPATAARAQWVGAIGDDALVLPRGLLRVSVGGTAADHDATYGGAGGERLPLGAALSFGASATPAVAGLAELEAALRVATGDATLTPSLGPLTIRATARRSVLPVRIDAGIGRRLQLTATIPYVETRVATSAAPPGEEVGDLGLNPARSIGAALDANIALVSGLRAGAEALAAQVAGCAADPTAPACADPAAATQLALDADVAAGAVAQIYGVEGSGGSPVVPTGGSAAAAAIGTRIAALRGALLDYGVASVPEGAAPAAPAAPLPPAAVAAALTDGAFGFGLPAFGQANRYGIGDVEVGARLRLLDPFDGSPAAGTPAGPFALRASVGALVRLGTGEPDAATYLADLGTGDGQTDVEASAAADLLVGRRFSASLSGRYGVQLAHELDRLVPGAAGEVYLPASAVRRVRRDLGDYAELEIAPRWSPTAFVALGAHYRFRAKGADRYTLADAVADPDDVPAPPAVDALGTGTETREHAAGVGVVLSTLSAYAAGRVRTPLEVSYRHSRTFAGRGRLAPHARVDEVRVQLYLRAFGGG